MMYVCFFCKIEALRGTETDILFVFYFFATFSRFGDEHFGGS